VKTGKALDLFEEMEKVSIRIILFCSFGFDLSEKSLPYYEDGKETTLSLSRFLFTVFSKLMTRKFSLQIILAPDTYKWYLGKADQEILRNVKTVRSVIDEVVEKRRELLKDPSVEANGDLLSTLLRCDTDVFKQN